MLKKFGSGRMCTSSMTQRPPLSTRFPTLLTVNDLIVYFIQRDREFYQHIKQNRADPSLFSLRNPAPDYYGEKIKSVQEYRTWLRKQRECIRKGTFHIGED